MKSAPRKDHRGVDLISDVLPSVVCGVANRTRPATLSTTQSLSATRITLWFAFMMRLAI